MNNELTDQALKARKAASDLLLQVRRLASLNRKIAAIGTVLKDYQETTAAVMDEENDKVARLDRIGRNQTSIENGSRNVQDASSLAEGAFEDIDVVVSGMLRLPKNIAVDAVQASRAVFPDKDTEKHFANQINALEAAIDKHIQTNDYHGVKADLSRLSTSLTNYFNGRDAKRRRRYQQINQIKKTTDDLTAVQTKLNDIFDLVDMEVDEYAKAADKLTSKVDSVMSKVLLESDEDIMKDFAKSERFGKPKHVDAVVVDVDKADDAEKTEADKTESIETTETVETVETTEAADVEKTDKAEAAEDADKAEKTDKTDKAEATDKTEVGADDVPQEAQSNIDPEDADKESEPIEIKPAIEVPAKSKFGKKKKKRFLFF